MAAPSSSSAALRRRESEYLAWVRCLNADNDAVNLLIG